MPTDTDELGVLELLVIGVALAVVESLVLAIPAWLVYANVISLDAAETIGYALVGLLASAGVRRLYRSYSGDDEEDYAWPLTLCLYLVSGGVLWGYFQTISAVAP